MAAADIPFVYEPLLDHDGVIDKTFRFLLEVAHEIDYNRKGCNDYAEGCIVRHRQSSHVIIANKDRTITEIGMRLGTTFIECMAIHTRLP